MHLSSRVKFESVTPRGSHLLPGFPSFSQLLLSSLKRTLLAKCMFSLRSVTLGGGGSVQSFNSPSLIRMDCWSRDFWLLGLARTLICSPALCTHAGMEG